MNYQAVIRNSSDMVVANQAIGIQISILQTSPTGSAVYVETQNPTTNANGLISIEIGSGSVVSGNFATIGWSSDTYYIKTEVDIAGGTSYTITGTSQLMSVPYALHAKTAETVASITETDPVFGASAANGITNTDITNWNSKLTNTLADTNVLVGNGSNEASAVAVSGDATLANDGTLTIADNAIDGTDISLTGEAAGDMTYFDGTDWIRLPKGTAYQSLVMNSGATAPEWQSGGATEDVEVILGSATGGNGTTIAIPVNISDYQYLRLESDNWDIASALHSVHGTVLVSDMASKRILIYADTVYYLHADINASGTSLTINCTGTATWRIVGIKAQKTVLDPSLTTVIDDDTFATASSSNVPSAESVKAYVDALPAINDTNASSGYIDIGNVRIQWGIATGPGTQMVTLPQPFASTNYSVTGNMFAINGDGVYSLVLSVNSTTQFSAVARYNSGGSANEVAAGEGFMWQAIGIKP